MDERIKLDNLYVLSIQELMDRWNVALDRMTPYKKSIRREYYWTISHEGGCLWCRAGYLGNEMKKSDRSSFCRYIHLLEYMIMMEGMIAD